MIHSVAIIQPPLVQLNGPYPSGAYLAAFFRNVDLPGCVAPRRVRWIDASNRFFRALFSRAGLTRLFSLCREAALAKASDAESRGDGESAFQLRRFVSLERAWIGWIDGIVAILCGGDRELSHAFVRSPHAPRGARMDAFLGGLDAEPSTDDARVLATLAIEDVADFIAVAFDGEFSLVRYAESIASSERRFAKVEAALSRPMVAEFLEPLCLGLWAELSVDLLPEGPFARPGERVLFCLSVPFPGCLVNALAMARSIRVAFGDRAVIAMGGGYVNTELRSCDNDRLFSYVDILSFDRGYGGYASLLRGDSVHRRLFCPTENAEYEDRVTRELVPDYADIDFSRYPRLADDPNPMHRLWSDGAWIKAYLAHGCYWHRCSFCDVSLDYIGAYRPVNVGRLYAGLRAQALAKGARGIHLVDEAAPPRALRDFALANVEASRISRPSSAFVLGSVSAADAAPAEPKVSALGPDVGILPFWGNIRFEKAFTRDLADFLSAGGLLGVSGGIEIATGEGFTSVDKGIDLASLVSVCAAFKEAGILVHGYLIYGYWDEDAQGFIDSVEAVRQLFAASLVDSAFWHKFVLTRHSRVYCEWIRDSEGAGGGREAGNRAGTRRSPRGDALDPIDERGDFADNDLRFRGEGESARYTAPLDAALSAWMAGEALDKPVRSWFPFSLPAPRIAGDLVERYIADYEKARDRARNEPCDPEASYYWAASVPVRVASALAWWYLGEEIRFPSEGVAADAILEALGFGDSKGEAPALADSTLLHRLPRAAFKALRHHGLCRISPL